MKIKARDDGALASVFLERTEKEYL